MKSPMDEPGRELEAKPTGIGRGRPMSWGDRVRAREHRRRAGKAAWLIGLSSRLFARWSRFSRSIGMTKRRIVVDGVVYRERSITSLRRCLAVTGSGVKEYDVRFPVMGDAMASAQYPMREEMRIRYTRRRMFGDLGHEPRVGFVEQVSELIKPGARVLELGCGTGSGSAILAGLVGPSGAVVSMNRDGESIRFARQRHRCDHLAFELGWLETLEGELDGGFDVVLAVDLFRDAGDAPSKSRAIGGVWRLVNEGGFLMVVCSDESGLGEVLDRLEAVGAKEVRTLVSDSAMRWVGVMGVRGKSGVS